VLDWDHNAYYHRLLLRQMPQRCRRVLDVGCGAGAFAAQLARRSEQVDALDRSAEMIEEAKRRTPGNVNCVLADVLADPLPGKDYDAIFSVSALHHMPLQDALLVVAAALRPGGVLAAIALPRPELRHELPVEIVAAAGHRLLGAMFLAKRSLGSNGGFIPDHELAALMAAVDHLLDPYQRAALIVARWSGARRGEIRRLAVDCLDTYPDGHPRLRIPVGKGYAERMIPLHPQAAEALQPVIELARQQNARKRFDPSAGRPVQHVFLVRGKLLSNAFLFDLSLKAACTTAGLVDSSGRPMITAHRFRHTIGTQLAEGGARIQTIMAILGHRTPNMSIIYSTLSDPTVKQQYQDALDGHLGADVTLAGPAAEALREHRLDPEAVSWLQTKFPQDRTRTQPLPADPG
jgi:integrase